MPLQPEDDPNHWITLFEGFAAEWVESIYSDPADLPLKNGTRIEVNRDNWRVNAWITHRSAWPNLLRRQWPHYKITAGAVVAFYDLFMTACCEPDFFPEVIPLETQSPRQLQSGRFRDYAFLASDANSTIVHRRPEDARRHNLALYLMTAAFHWLLYHEESHYLAGHLLLVEREYGASDIGETQTEEIEADTYESLRALESHADERANLQTVRIYANEPGLSFHPIEELRTAGEGVRIALVALGAVLLLFQANEPEPLRRKHPWSLTRLLDAFGAVFNTLRTREASIYGPPTAWIQEAVVREIFNQAIRDLQSVARLLGIRESLFNVINPLFQPGKPTTPYTQELLTLKRRLAALRPGLERCRQTLFKGALRGKAADQW
jgi:hypothetical protein